jgi:hypothetical protein
MAGHLCIESRFFVAEKPLVLLANHGLNRVCECRPAFPAKTTHLEPATLPSTRGFKVRVWNESASD